MSNMEMPQKEKKWHWLFEAALLVRGINGALEIVAGFFILYGNKNLINRIFFHFAKGELKEDPTDKVLIYLNNSVQNLSVNTKIFVAIYILAHGVLNIFLSIQLYREKIWAYRATLIIMSGFIIYQVIRIYTHHSVVLIVLTAIDLLFMVLLWHEYKFRLSHPIKNSQE